MGFLSKLFGPKVDFAALKAQGAQIVDVRTRQEYQGGHIRGSVNIPLDQLSANTGKLDKTKPVITCCASGMRSGSAVGLLKSKGFGEVYNGGGWYGLQNKLKA